MGKESKIEWTHHTWNPWIGCAKVSDGCKNCYAEEMMDKRYGKAQWGVNGTRVVTSDANWKQPLKWNREAEKEGVRKRVFCASLADVFEDRPELHEPRTRFFDLIRQTPHLDWLLLTKRPENIVKAINQSLVVCQDGDASDYQNWLIDHGEDFPENDLAYWLNDWFDNPPHNVWLGTSVENQEAADKRIPELLKVPATVRFLSCEPLLGPVDLINIPTLTSDVFLESIKGRKYGTDNGLHAFPNPIDWCIVGGESGPNARPMHPDWARSLRDQCNAAGVAFHFKQWGEWVPSCEQKHYGTTPMRRMDADGNGHVEACVVGFPNVEDFFKVGKKASGRLLDGKEWNEFPKVEVAA